MFCALLWKNLKSRRRGWSTALAELGGPYLISLVIIVMIATTRKELRREEHYRPTDYSRETVSSAPLVYSPQSPAIDLLMEIGHERSKVPYTLAYKSVNEGYNFLQKFHPSRPMVVFDGVSSETTNVPTNLRFKILVDKKSWSDNSHGENFLYGLNGVLVTQQQVTQIFLNYWQRTRQHRQQYTINISTQKMPSGPLYTRDKTAARLTLALTFGFFFIGLACLTARDIVEERETKVKDALQMVGVNLFTYWMALVVTNVILGVITSSVVLLVLYAGKLITAHIVLLAIFFLMVVFNVVSFACAASCFLDNAQASSVVVAMVYLLFDYCACHVTDIVETAAVIYVIGTFMFHLGTRVTLSVISTSESSGKILDAWDLFEESGGQRHSIIEGLVIIMLNTSFNFLVVWFLEHVTTDEFGSYRLADVFLTKDFWCPPLYQERKLPEIPKSDVRFREEAQPDCKVGVRFRKLVKVFGDQVAVSGIAMEAFEDQITVLLGHRGSGKTTVFALLTGTLPPTSGTAFISKFDINRSIGDVRHILGFCSQTNILYDRLTCEENLIFYSKLRGGFNNETKNDVNNLLSMIGIYNKHFFPKELSDVERRKLSIACAFVGNTQVVLIDEPTGLTPNARKDIWTFLRMMRTGRTILVATDSMAEATALGDRIVILSHGQIKAVGSSRFLKRLYGTGYRISIVKDLLCDVEKVNTAIMSFAQKAEYLGEYNAEVHYRLPIDYGRRYAKLFRVLHKFKESLKIRGFVLSSVTLEDVFVRIGQDIEPTIVITEEKPKTVEAALVSASKATSAAVLHVSASQTSAAVLHVSASQPSTTVLHKLHKLDHKGSSHVDARLPHEELVTDPSELFTKLNDFPRQSGLGLYSQQIIALLSVKLLLCRRRLFYTFLVHMTPFLLLVLGMALHAMDLLALSREPLFFSLDRFKKTVTFLAVNKSVLSPLVDAYVSQFKPPHQVRVLSAASSNLSETIINLVRIGAQRSYREEVIISADLRNEPVSSNAFYQTGFIHSEAISVQMLLNAHVKHRLGQGFSVQSGVHNYVPMSLETHATMIFSIFLITVAWVPGTYAYDLISERASGVRHLQLLNGVSNVCYWHANFLFHMLHMVIMTCELLLVGLYSPDVYLTNSRWSITVTLLAFHALVIVPYVYLLQRFFATPWAGVAVIMGSNIFTGVVLGFSTAFTKLTNEYSRSGPLFYYSDLVLLALSPSYALAAGLVNFLYMPETQMTDRSYLDYLEGGDNGSIQLRMSLTALMIQYPVMWMLLVVAESLSWESCWQSFRLKDSKVKAGEKDKKSNPPDASEIPMDRESVVSKPLDGIAETDAVTFINASKWYRTGVSCKGIQRRVAVGPISLRLAKNECFGILGAGGAGKSTLLGLVVGHIPSTSGDVFVHGFRPTSEPNKIRSLIGYCPQRGGLYDLLTGRESISLFCRLRGVPRKAIDELTNGLIGFVSLRPNEDIMTKSYSLACRRKLLVALALVNNPSLVLLEEPTTNMDHESSVAIWNVIKKLMLFGCTVIFTSQSASECKALSSRLAILVKGKLIYDGSPKDIMVRHAQGLTVTIHAKMDDSGQPVSLVDVVLYVKEVFPMTKVIAEGEECVHLHVPINNKPIYRLFATLQMAHHKIGFEKFLVRHTTMEDVYTMLQHGT